MKTKSTPLLWVIFFALTLVLLNEVAKHYVEPREIKLTREQAQNIGKKIWLNEGAGKYENLIVWNKGEDFPSLGIGHFIWYPKKVNQTFKESFPQLIQYIQNKTEIPEIVKNTKFPPWNSREEFLQQKSSTFSIQLRQFLNNTIAEQTQFIILRLEKALPDMLKEIKNPFAKRHVRESFYQVAMQENGVYALVDYVNFKGEGISEKERYNNLGWGLSQVLENMDSTAENPLQAFAESADRMLTRRVANAPRDETRWLPGWRKRLQTYTRDSG